MSDYTHDLPAADTCHLGPHDLFIEKYAGDATRARHPDHPPVLFVHGAFTGSWMWAKYVRHLSAHGIDAFYMNLRGHYRSRSVDFSSIVFSDYLDDIRLVVETVTSDYDIPPVLVGFSMGGLLCMKLAEDVPLSGLVLIDSSICTEVHSILPYKNPPPTIVGPIVPAPIRSEATTIDETEDDIAFQRKYLSMEAANVYRNLACPYGETGISVRGDAVSCPSLVISAIASEDDELRGRALAQHTGSDYLGLRGTTHTGLLVGSRYGEVVSRLLAWLNALPN
jgi:pimeloyl-ACP methyl ester carboxylesterase